ncbi:DNA-binding protein [Pseudomonas sp. CCC2.2]|uniref:DNA-binding protein n=1 Tax=Pseudomonas sp. CCC2.2 TaxID=3048605 RepID=UPI002B238FFF|nr:DNA-binding protein [Pseudomonas sp. CCC2.2]MEB0149041.1 DNA-binding protein [Pseudomonas sp. CCC2.2]
MNTLRTREDARLWIISQGISVKDFAEAHHLDIATTYQVLSGAKRGMRGKAHSAAVALGIKRSASKDE